MSVEGDNTKLRLIKAAKKLFSQYSYDYVSTRMIAEKASIGQSAIFFHFGSKVNLFSAVVNDIIKYHDIYYDPIYKKVSMLFEQGEMTSEKARELIVEYYNIQVNIAFDPRNRYALSISSNYGLFPEDTFQPLLDSIRERLNKPLARLINIYKKKDDKNYGFLIAHSMNTLINGFIFTSGYSRLKNNLKENNIDPREYISKGILNLVMTAIDNAE